MLLWTSGIWGCEEDGLMSMVTSPQGSVQPVELEFTFRGIAWRLTSLEEMFLFDGLLPPHEGNSSMLDYGKISNSMTFKLPSWERCGQAATRPEASFCLLPCVQQNFKIRNSTRFKFCDPKLSHSL